ncbi:DUF1186 domain-containing protein [Zunongwangia pacifica]|uniref:DUF1186 domain-containing protein n=1 Tax=Zunongwangia pacifica TaxID=2911062 RepID=UPI00237D11FB|nr:DUF1186 domain-containing protein [Zunongwangia pacifica]
MLQYQLQTYTISSDHELLDNENHINSEIREILESIHPDVLKGKGYLLKKLPRLIKQYPRVPALKNFLATLHKERGEMEQAFKANRWLVKEHPYYLFGRLNLAAEYLENDQLEKIPEVLGEMMELKSLYPNREEFHIEEFIAFNQISVLYFLAQDDIEQAEMRVDMMVKVAPDHPKTKYVRERIEHYILIKAAERKQRENEEYHSPEVTDRRSHLQTDKAPVFNFPIQMQWLYEEDYDFPKNKLETILKLERQPLIEDLKKLLNDSIARYDYFMEDDEMDFLLFPIHTLFILEELNAEQALPEIFDILKQDEDFYEIYFGDFANNVVASIIFTFGENNLQQFFDFLKTPNLYGLSKSYVSEGIAFLANEKSALRESIQSHYKDLLLYFIAEKQNENLIDHEAYGLIIADIIDLRMEELLPQIKELYQLNLVAKSINGEFDNIEETFKKPEFIREQAKLPKADLFKKYKIWKADYEAYLEKEFKDFDEELEDDDFSLYDRFFEDEELEDDFDMDDVPFDEEAFQRLIMNNEDQQPIIKQKEPGRNDPCPCGSGKKYKKCCLNKK